MSTTTPDRQPKAQKQKRSTEKERTAVLPFVIQAVHYAVTHGVGAKSAVTLDSVSPPFFLQSLHQKGLLSKPRKLLQPSTSKIETIG